MLPARRLVPVALLAASIVLTGCHGGASASASGSSHATSKPKPVVTVVASATPVPSASPVAASPACTRNGLKITYQPTDNSAGHFHGVLTFVNSGAACSVNGYPVVYLGQPEAEETVGAVSTDDTSTTPTAVTLVTGGSAHAAITITDAGAVCDPVDTTYLVASPPLDHPFVLENDGEHVDNVDVSACNDATVSLVHVGPITAG